MSKLSAFRLKFHQKLGSLLPEFLVTNIGKVLLRNDVECASVQLENKPSKQE